MRAALDTPPTPDPQAFPPPTPAPAAASAGLDPAAFAAGVRALSPILLGVVPFGMIAGASTVAAGLPVSAAVGLSVVMFAGAAQLAVVELLAQGASPLVGLLTAWVINVRFLMYSASLAPWLRAVGRRWKALAAYLLTDQAYAVSVARFEERPGGPRLSFYLGGAVTLWTAWQLSTIAGVLLGSGLPPAIELEFAIPLTFIALMVPMLKNRPRILAAAVAGAVAVVARGLPFNLGLLVAVAGGVAAGSWLDGGSTRHQPAKTLPEPCPEPCGD